MKRKPTIAAAVPPPNGAALLSSEDLARLQKERLDYFEDIHLNPGKRFSPSGNSFLRLTPDERRELKAARPYLFPAPSHKSVDDDARTEGKVMGGFNGAAVFIRDRFPGKNFSHTSISNWMNGELPAGITEKFPKSHHTTTGKQWWTEAEIVSWVERNLLPMASKPNYRGDPREEQRWEDLRRTQEENELWRQANSDKYLETVIAEGAMEGFFVWVSQKLDKLMEDKRGMRQLVQEAGAAVGISEDQLIAQDTLLAVSLPKANDAFKTDCVSQRAEMLKQIMEDRLAQIAENLKQK